MTIQEIVCYLSNKNTELNNKVSKAIEELRQKAIDCQNEDEANYCWCLKQIYKIQNEFISSVNALKKQKYENAWCMLDRADIELGFLENNFDIAQEKDKYHLVFIGNMIKEYQKLFPYHYFFSRESIIKAEVCSICGKTISLRHPCGHKVGKLYMGELCLRNVTDIEFKAESIVTDPLDKYAYLKFQDREYNYGMLEALMMEIDTPYDEFHIETIQIQRPEYKGIGRNELCPCGSGKKYKKCHLGTKDELMNHYKVHILKPNLKTRNRYIGTFMTWK